MVNNQFIKHFIGGMDQQKFLNMAHDYVQGKANLLTVTDPLTGRTYTLKKVQLDPAAPPPRQIAEQLTSELIISHIFMSMKLNLAVLVDNSGDRPRVTGTREAVAAYRNRQPTGEPLSDEEIAEITAEELEQAEKEAQKEELAKHPTEKSTTAKSPQPQAQPLEKSRKPIISIETKSSEAGLIFAKSIAKTIQKVAKAREQEKAIVAERTRIKEKKKVEKEAAQEHHRIVDEEVKRSENRMTISKNERAKKQSS